MLTNAVLPPSNMGIFKIHGKNVKEAWDNL
jgi:hypothetical protein